MTESIDTIAEALFAAYRQGRKSAAPHHDVPPWEQLDDEKRAGWYAAAGAAKSLHETGHLAAMERKVSRAATRRAFR